MGGLQRLKLKDWRLDIMKVLTAKREESFMLNFRNTSAPAYPRDLEQLIYDVAEYQRDADFQLLYKRMQDRVVYVPVNSKSLPKEAHSGTRYVTMQKDSMRCYTVLGPQDQVLVVCTTRHDAAIIDDGYVEMKWCDFLAMVLKLDDSVYGALLQGEASWIGMDRERTRYILGLA